LHFAYVFTMPLKQKLPAMDPGPADQMMWSRYMYRAIVLLSNAVEYMGRAFSVPESQIQEMLDIAKSKIDDAQRSAQYAASLKDVPEESHRMAMEMKQLLADLHKEVASNLDIALFPAAVEMMQEPDDPRSVVPHSLL
jgi:hypothetical protein